MVKALQEHEITPCQGAGHQHGDCYQPVLYTLLCRGTAAVWGCAAKSYQRKRSAKNRLENKIDPCFHLLHFFSFGFLSALWSPRSVVLFHNKFNQMAQKTELHLIPPFYSQSVVTIINISVFNTCSSSDIYFPIEIESG